MIKILLIRHALTDFTGKRLSGRTPGISLNAEGKKQAKELAERIAEMQISAVFSSPLERALETAGPIAELFNLPVIISKDLLEIDFGKWTNCTIEEIKNDPQFERFNSFRSGTRIPGGELMSEAQMRIITILENLRSRRQNETVAVISHADLIRSAIAYYAGIHLDLIQRIVISPASLSILEIYDNNARILLLNKTV